MYADRYVHNGGVKPGSLAVALAINGGVLAAVLLAAPTLVTRPKDDGLIIKNIPLLPIIEPEPAPEPMPHPNPAPTLIKPKLIIDRPIPIVPIPIIPGPGINVTGSEGGTGTGTGVTIDPPAPPPAPVFVDTQIDQRYAGALQPEYPAAERRIERSGAVVVRVLVGIDGRVREIERVSATSDDFFNATRVTALRQWRFRPATRDGVPVERWKTMRVSFHFENA